MLAAATPNASALVELPRGRTRFGQRGARGGEKTLSAVWEGLVSSPADRKSLDWDEILKFFYSEVAHSETDSFFR